MTSYALLLECFLFCYQTLALIKLHFVELMRQPNDADFDKVNGSSILKKSLGIGEEFTIVALDDALLHWNKC